eukprot:321790-Rhodomonas_salina.1
MSHFMRELDVPILSLQSSLEVLQGMPISTPGDSTKLRRFVTAGLQKQMFCPANSAYGETSEERNVLLYITAEPTAFGSEKPSLMQAKLASDSDGADAKRTTMMQHVIKLLKDDLERVSQFQVISMTEKSAAVCPSAEVAMVKMMVNDFFLGGLLGSNRLFYDHKSLIKHVMGRSRFEGVPEMHREQFAFLRVFGDGHTARFGINLPTSLVFASLMQSFRRDWDVMS